MISSLYYLGHHTKFSMYTYFTLAKRKLSALVVFTQTVTGLEKTALGISTVQKAHNRIRSCLDYREEYRKFSCPQLHLERIRNDGAASSAAFNVFNSPSFFNIL